jgi:hypothetical protein
MRDRLSEIKVRLAAATPGPWAWFGNTQVKNLYLATVALGRRCVMGFARWGMNAAQPVFQRHDADGNGTMVSAVDLVQYEVPYRKDVSGINNPDADLIANAPADLTWAVAEIERLSTVTPEMVRRAAEAVLRFHYPSMTLKDARGTMATAYLNDATVAIEAVLGGE